MDVQLLEERTDFISIYTTMELMHMGYVLSVQLYKNADEWQRVIIVA